VRRIFDESQIEIKKRRSAGLSAAQPATFARSRR